MKKSQKQKILQANVSPLEPMLAGYVSSERDKERAAVPSPAHLLVGECIDEKHPSLTGRVLVRWEDDQSNEFEQWVPALQGLSVRKHDRVLLQQPLNWPEPVVFGVLDGCLERPETEYSQKPSVELKPDETLRIESHNGQPLVEIIQKNDSPVVRLLSDDVNLDLNGKLSISAQSIDMRAKQGQFNIKSEANVVVKGEVIDLN